MRAGVVRLLDFGRDLQTTTQGGFAPVEVASGLGGDAPEGVEREVVVGVIGEEFFADFEGFVVAFFGGEGVGADDGAAGGVVFGDLGDVGVGFGEIAAGDARGAGVELHEAFAVSGDFGRELDGLFEGVASAAGEADGAEGDAELGGAEEAGAAVVGENAVVARGEVGGFGEGGGGVFAALHLEFAEAEEVEGADVFGFAGDDVGELGAGFGDAVGVEEDEGGGELH